VAERYGADYRPGLEAAAPDGLLVGVVRLGSRIQLGILLAITILATASWVGRRDTAPEVPSSWAGDPRGDLERGRVCTSPWCPGRDPSISVESLLRLAECTAAAGQPLMTPALGIGNLGPNVAPSRNRSEGGPDLPPSSRSGETCAGCRVLGDRGACPL